MPFFFIPKVNTLSLMKPLFIAIFFCVCSNVCATQVKILTEHLPPFQLVQKDNIGGFATQIVIAAFEKAGVDYSLSNHLWTDAYQFTLKTPNTCLYSTTRTQEREDLFIWIGKITDLTTALVAKAGSNIKLENLEDAKQYTIEVMKDDFFHQALVAKGFVENQNLYVNTTYDALMPLLELPSRQIDLVIINEKHLRYRLSKSQSLDDVKIVLEVDELKSEMYLACNKNTLPAVARRLKSAMRALSENGELKLIESNWFMKLRQN